MFGKSKREEKELEDRISILEKANHNLMYKLKKLEEIADEIDNPAMFDIGETIHNRYLVLSKSRSNVTVLQGHALYGSPCYGYEKCWEYELFDFVENKKTSKYESTLIKLEEDGETI